MAVAYPDIWAEDLRLEVDAHLFSLRGREFQRDILRDESNVIIVPKGAQLGFTTLFILKSVHAIVQRSKSVLYLLPLKAGSIPFVQGRIDPILDSNKELAREFSRTDNRSQKVTARGVKWYIRGTNIETELREVPADILVLDERDKANEGNLDDAYARLDGSEYARVYELSTPTIDGHGVYGENGWATTDQMQWWVPCPHCNAKQVLSFEENILPNLGDTIEESSEACRCSHCHLPLSDDDRALMNERGTWVPLSPGAQKRGYHLSQLNSPTKKLADPQTGMLVNWFAGQNDSKKLKAFYTLSLGLPYAAPGEKFSVELLDKCRGNFLLGGIPEGNLFIGIDQGHDVLHLVIWTRAMDSKRLRLWQCMPITADGARTKWTVLDEDYLQTLTNWVAVCDAHPDKEDCEALSKKYPGRFFMGFEKDRPDQEETAKFQKATWGEPTKVNIDRTMAFDQYIKMHINGQIALPRDARELGERMPKKPYNGYYHHHLQMTRVEQADSSERLVARWVNGKVGDEKTTQKSQKQGNRPDHWHHAGMFGLVASMTDVPLIVPADVGELFARSGGLIAHGA